MLPSFSMKLKRKEWGSSPTASARQSEPAASDVSGWGAMWPGQPEGVSTGAASAGAWERVLSPHSASLYHTWGPPGATGSSCRFFP